MKRLFQGFMLLILAVVLVACEGSKEEDVENDDEGSEDVVQEGSTDTREVVDVIEEREDELGKFKVTYKEDNVGEVVTSGDMELRVLEVEVAALDLAVEYQQQYGREELIYVRLGVEVENKGEDINNFYPNHAAIVTDKGEQTTADLVYTDDVGGNFRAGDIKTGDLTFFLDEGDANMESFTFEVHGTTKEGEFESEEDIDLTIVLEEL